MNLNNFCVEIIQSIQFRCTEKRNKKNISPFRTKLKTYRKKRRKIHRKAFSFSFHTAPPKAKKKTYGFEFSPEASCCSNFQPFFAFFHCVLPPHTLDDVGTSTQPKKRKHMVYVTDYECARVSVCLCIVRNCQLWIIWKCRHDYFFCCCWYFCSELCASVYANLFYSSTQSQQPVRLYFGLPTIRRRKKDIQFYINTLLSVYCLLFFSSSHAHPFQFNLRVSGKNRLNERIKKHRSIFFNVRIHIYPAYLLIGISNGFLLQFIFRLCCSHSILFLFLCGCTFFFGVYFLFNTNFKLIRLNSISNKTNGSNF